MQTSAKIICDSVYEGDRITTMEVVMHRFVLAEFNTHRMFSRNSASSRAIPVGKQLERVDNNPAFPISWPKEQPGMQGGEELDSLSFNEARDMYEDIRNYTVNRISEYLLAHVDKNLTLHKSVINRLLEPFMWHTVVVTSTEWDNFFIQRCSPLAQPEIRAAAELMHTALLESVPEQLNQGQWHLPYILDEEKAIYKDQVLIKASVARCARVSTLHQDDKADVLKDIELYTKLVTADPPHWSPLEHVAMVDYLFEGYHKGNFQSSIWSQFRHNKVVR